METFLDNEKVEIIKSYVKRLKTGETNAEEAVEIIKEDERLSSTEKNLIYCYCFPRPLLDRELPSRVRTDREKRGDVYNRGKHEPDLDEVRLILEAGKTPQYSRFIKHLMVAFSEPENMFSVEASDNIPPEKLVCPICGKSLYTTENWNSEKDKWMGRLGIGSTKSSVVVCKNCIIQINAAKELVSLIDPSFLEWFNKEK